MHATPHLPKRGLSFQATRGTMRAETLLRMDILSALPATALHDLAAVSSVFAGGRGDEVYWQEDSHSILAVLDGEVDACLVASKGRALPIVLIEHGDFVDAGPDGWTGGESAAAVILSRRALLCSMPYDAFESAIDCSVDTVRLLASARERWTQQVLGLATDRLYANPDVRIRRVLWRDSRCAPPEGVRYLQWRLAARACTDQPRVSKEIGRLSREGIVVPNRSEHRLHVVDRHRLLKG